MPSIKALFSKCFRQITSQLSVVLNAFLAVLLPVWASHLLSRLLLFSKSSFISGGVLFLFCWMAAFNYLLLPYTAAVCPQIMNPLRSPFLPSPAHTRSTSCCFAVMTVWRGVRGSAEDPCLCPSQLMGSFPAFCSDPPACAPVQHSLGRDAILMTDCMELSYARQGISPDIFIVRTETFPCCLR